MIALLVSCSDDEKTSSYSFKDQDLKGKIGNVAWTFEDGFVEVETIEGELMLDFRMFQDQDEDACDVLFAEGNEVFFDVPNEVGLYKLHLNLNTGEGQTVTLFEDEGFMNNIATDGAVEILTITETEVTGRMDVRFNKKNFVNGNFTIFFCQDPS
jgi:hypothetical protein